MLWLFYTLHLRTLNNVLFSTIKHILKTQERKNSLLQRSESFFSKGSDSKYFRLFRPYNVGVMIGNGHVEASGSVLFTGLVGGYTGVHFVVTH